MKTAEQLKDRTVVTLTGCWEWLGSKSGGYGSLGSSGGYVHRIMYEAAKGPIPDGLTLDHLCRNKACCNPDHLEPVTCRENTARGLSPVARNMRKTHCPQGHAYDEGNTYWKRGIYNMERTCKECNRRRARERQRRIGGHVKVYKVRPRYIPSKPSHVSL